MNWYLTSDLHLGHVGKKYIIWKDRGFSSVDEMNEHIVTGWNNRVTDQDTVIVVGDFALGPKENVALFASRLNGNKIIILGNHDRKALIYTSEGFNAAYKELYITIDEVPVYIRHEPDYDFKSSNNALYHICGHVHSLWHRKGHIINVGVDLNQYQPITVQEAIATLEG